MGIRDKLAHAWNAFNNEDSEEYRMNTFGMGGVSYGSRPDRLRMNFSNERSIISSIYTRLAIDVASIEIQHIRKDSNNRYLNTVDSGLNNCLTFEANIDQAARAFKLDIALSLFDKGVIALVPVDTAQDPVNGNAVDIKTMRVGHIVAWYPRHVRVSVYNDRTGQRQELNMPKDIVAIIENPLYSVMNEPNSTLQRLNRKLNLLDSVDEASGSGKLDMIIQLPYVIKSEARRDQAAQRAKDITDQLKGSQYGIAYTDGTEKITQLNRPVENNMLKQIEYLSTMLYSQLGLTEAVFNGTASEAEMLNYHNRTVEPILAAITEGIKRRFLTKTARTQGQDIQYIRDPFKLVAISNIAEIADKFSRNEILSPNEIRQIIGFKPAEDPKAEELHNSNMPTVPMIEERPAVRTEPIPPVLVRQTPRELEQ